jgi:hypothetical protein
MMFWEKILLITVSLLTNVNKDMGLSYTNNTKNDRRSTCQWVLIRGIIARNLIVYFYASW